MYTAPSKNNMWFPMHLIIFMFLFDEIYNLCGSFFFMNIICYWQLQLHEAGLFLNCSHSFDGAWEYIAVFMRVHTKPGEYNPYIHSIFLQDPLVYLVIIPRFSYCYFSSGVLIESLCLSHLCMIYVLHIMLPLFSSA